jgi:hypothetical protein
VIKITIPFKSEDGLRLFIKFYILGYEFVGFYKDIAWVLEKEEYNDKKDFDMGSARDR